jgi:hydrogenase maturation protein HypF
MPNLSKASLHVTGIVQGVGFRPFVYGLAIRCHLQGWVRNSSAGVDIEVDGTSETLRIFIEALKTELPPLARIDSLDITYSTPGNFKTFEIIGSESVPGAFQPISPDVCIC